jgi:hypothetical protein
MVNANRQKKMSNMRLSHQGGFGEEPENDTN